MEQLVKTKSPELAAFLSFLLPGIGQFHNGKKGKGITFLIIGVLGWLSFPYNIIFNTVASIDAYQDAKDFNSLIEVKNMNRNYSNVSTQDNPAQIKTEYYDGHEFVSKMQKNYKLFINGLYTEEEYNKNKSKNISTLASKTISNKNDFLFSIISLKDEYIINEEDIKKIKALI